MSSAWLYYDVSSVFSLDFLLLSLQKVFNFAGNSIKGNILRKTHLVSAYSAELVFKVLIVIGLEPDW